LGDKEIHLSARGGVALYPNDGRDADELWRNAEAALKRAKQSGERLTYYAPHFNASVAQRLELETKLRGAIDKREFLVHYQPKINLAANRISGFEALLRWHDPQLGLITPGQFIPALEETGLIVTVGRWVIEEVVRALPALDQAGFGAMPVAVNVSAVQLRERTFVDEMRAVLASAEGLHRQLEIEITESIFLDDLAESETKLRTLRDLGMRVAIDDFGTGFSSLSYLSKLPVDTLKIDQSFVSRITEEPEAKGIVATVIALAHTLHLRVIAEGVENAEQAVLLRQLDCDEAQGFFYGPAVPLDELKGSVTHADPQL
jgi:EAL domain-containing protein (putative c-di-GMP-specific phosphodiesterase class I)